MTSKISSGPTAGGKKDAGDAPVIFNINSIADEAARKAVIDDTKVIKRALTAERSSMVAIGQALTRVKGILGHGQFGPWLKVSFGMTHRTADNYMNAARLLADPKLERLSTLPKDALYRLGREGVPPAAVEEVLALVDAGEHIGHETVCFIIAKHSLPTDPKRTSEAMSKKNSRNESPGSDVTMPPAPDLQQTGERAEEKKVVVQFTAIEAAPSSKEPSGYDLIWECFKAMSAVQQEQAVVAADEIVRQWRSARDQLPATQQALEAGLASGALANAA